MASVEKRVRDGTTTWLARWRDPEGRQRKRSFARKLDADRFLVGIEADRLRGSYVDPADKTTVVEYARQWIAARPHRPSTAERHRHIVEAHIAPTRLGTLPLVAIRPSDVQGWATDRASVLAPSTLRLVVSLVRSIFASAVLDRRITSSPVVRIALPRDDAEHVVPLTVTDVRELAAAMPRRNQAMVVTQAGLGLRLGELLGLRVEDVDFLSRTVSIRWQITRHAGRSRTDTKTPQSRRTVPLPKVVADALSAHLAEFGPGSDGSLFATVHGNPYRNDYYDKLFRAVVARTTLPKGTSSHDLRHHYASVLLAAGESVVAVAARLGHENASLVLSTYGHLMPDSEERTRRAVDEAWCAPEVPREQESGA